VGQVSDFVIEIQFAYILCIAFKIHSPVK